MPFLGQEGHVLHARKACSELLLRPFCNREGHEEGKRGEGSELSVNPDHSVLLCSSVRKRKHLRVVERFFSHRTHRFNRTFLRTVSNSQNASGIQISQNVIAKGDCKVLCYRLT